MALRRKVHNKEEGDVKSQVDGQSTSSVFFFSLQEKNRPAKLGIVTRFPGNSTYPWGLRGYPEISHSPLNKVRGQSTPEYRGMKWLSQEHAWFWRSLCIPWPRKCSAAMLTSQRLASLVTELFSTLFSSKTISFAKRANHTNTSFSAALKTPCCS